MRKSGPARREFYQARGRVSQSSTRGTGGVTGAQRHRGQLDPPRGDAERVIKVQSKALM